MSKQVKILFILVIVALAVYFLYTSKPWSSVKGGDETAFAIEDTGAVTKVFMADGRGTNTLLEKQADGHWMVDKQFTADERKVNLMLQTIHDVKLRNPVGQGEFNNVLKSFTASGVKVEFYSGDELTKTLYVGQMTSDQGGTYMMLEGASAPYVTHIPGFVGYLTPRFLTEPVKWRSRLIFNSQAEEIARLSVTYPLSPEHSFSIDHSGAAPVVKDGKGNTVNIADSNFLKYYLSGFTQLYGEGYDEIYNRQQQDSIAQTDAYCIINLQTRSGKEQVLTLHIKGLERSTKDRYDEKGNLLKYDTEKYYAFINKDPNMMYVQQFNFGRVLRHLDEFTSKK